MSMFNSRDGEAVEREAFAASRGSASVAGLSPEEDAQIEETTWRWFAEAHPHEAYATWPERFWQLFQELRPGVSREEMERVLSETEREATQNVKLSDASEAFAPASG